ncbi:MAG: hypothetical protein LBS69_05380 [Prevotellaceae bacterium]|jgi:hypothetical protein|nr:hypothetical protein [Prevotellaceae bacterium]
MNDLTKKNLKYGLGTIALTVIFLVMLVVFISKIIKSDKTFSVLCKDGLITNAVVVESFVNKSGSSGFDIIICRYYVDGLAYTTQKRAVTKIDYDYKVGDTLKIIYSEKDPTVYRIIDACALYDIELVDSVMMRLAEN